MVTVKIIPAIAKYSVNRIVMLGSFISLSIRNRYISADKNINTCID
ncbi:hypothetical protein [Chryseobacterium sp. JAH]|nr:hypothetical protein [Chryseobacterium sp. JAH]